MFWTFPPFTKITADFKIFKFFITDRYIIQKITNLISTYIGAENMCIDIIIVVVMFRLRFHCRLMFSSSLQSQVQIQARVRPAGLVQSAGQVRLLQGQLRRGEK